MTDGINRHYENAKSGRSNWATAKISYSQQRISDAPYERRPSNATGAVDHFSKKVKLRKYKAPEDHKCNGQARLGDYETVDFWCVINIPTSGSKGLEAIKESNGERSEGYLSFYYNPFFEEHPDEGIHLQLADSETSDYNGFSDIIEYQGLLWSIKSLVKIDVDYDGNEKYYLGMGEMRKWSEPTVISSEAASTGHYAIS